MTGSEQEAQAEAYEQRICEAGNELVQKKLIKRFELTEHNSKWDKRGCDGFINFRIDNNKSGCIPFQLKRRWGAVITHRKKYPVIPPVIISIQDSREVIIGIFIEFMAFWQAFNCEKKEFFLKKGLTYAQKYYKHYDPPFLEVYTELKNRKSKF